VLASDLKAVGAMAALLRDALKPNLVQTVEGVPALVHGGPFANIAHGTNSVAATRLAMSYADIVITEAGFAFELGAEKFFDINCRYGGFAPCCTVLVATLRALKMHGGVPIAQVSEPDTSAVARGLENLDKHVENIRKFEQRCVVAINHFRPTRRRDRGGEPTARCWSQGGGVEAVLGRRDGCRELGEVVWEVASLGDAYFRPLYDWADPIEKKIARSRARCTAPKPSTTRRAPSATRPSSRSSATTSCRCAWRRPSSRCRTTRRCWGGRRTSW